jgi:cysteine desulfurase/selenocysteine lyase
MDLKLKNDFPVFATNPKLVYFDSACTSLKPKSVIDAELEYYTSYGACGGRSSHLLGRKVSERVMLARETVARFVNASGEEIVWTKNCTEGLNIVASGFDFSKRRKVVTSIREHHAVLLPYMRLRDEGKIELVIVKNDDEWANVIDRNTALVVTNNCDNTSGFIPDVARIAKIAHENGAAICVDGAQGVPHHRTDFRKLGLDFLSFSGHKMLGPTGIGALVVRSDFMNKLRPMMTGGGTVKTVKIDRVEELKDQTRFEPGVQNYAGMFGFEAACKYLLKIGMENVEAHEKKIGELMRKALDEKGASIYSVASGGLCSFNFKGAKAHDVALMLDEENIAVRSGFFCAQPAVETMGAKDGAVRASAYIYNDSEDVKKFAQAVAKINILYS